MNQIQSPTGHGRKISITADVGVLGAGSLGLWTAAWLKRQGFKVFLLDVGNVIASAATTMNASLGSRMFVCNREVWALTHVGMRHWENPPRDIFDTPIARSLDVAYLASERNHVTRMNELFQLASQSGASYQVVDMARLEEELPNVPASERVGGIIESGLRFDVPNMLAGMSEYLSNEIVTNAFTYDAERTAAQTWLVKTFAGQFEAPIIVDATGSRGDATGRLFGGTALNLQTTKRHRIIADVDQPDRLSRDGLFVFSSDGLYWVREPDGSVLISPADETSCTPQDNDLEPKIINDAINLFESLAGVKIRSYRRVTAGHRPFVDGRVPVASFDPAAEGFARLLAPSGYGMQGGPALAQVMANAISGLPFPAELADLGLAYHTFALTPALSRQEVLA